MDLCVILSNQNESILLDKVGHKHEIINTVDEIANDPMGHIVLELGC